MAIPSTSPTATVLSVGLIDEWMLQELGISAESLVGQAPGAAELLARAKFNAAITLPVDTKSTGSSLATALLEASVCASVTGLLPVGLGLRVLARKTNPASCSALDASVSREP
jgi:hypothetical protein